MARGLSANGSVQGPLIPAFSPSRIEKAPLRLRILAELLVWLTAFGAEAAEGHSFSFREPANFRVDGERFRLDSEEGLAAFARRAEGLAGRKTVGKKDRRGLREMVRLEELHAGEGSMFRREAIRRQILEVASAIANNHRPVIPSYVGLPDLPFRFVDSLRNPVAVGRTAASNLAPGGRRDHRDLSRADPLPSSYWRKPAAIGEADLYAGFGRAALPVFSDRMWSYAGPKQAGGNPGCEVVSGSQRLKAKFAEKHSEPFTSRIFHALGYHVEATDYSPGLKLRYDRRFFTEFNRLPEIKMKIGVLFVPIYTFHFERRYDPFAYVERAVFTDGSECSGAELKRRLLREVDGELSPGNFRREVEGTIDYLVTVSANVQVEGENGKSIGPWDFGGLGREHLRELRGAGVLAAWLGWWDARFDNTRLRLVQTGNGVELRHFFSDLGAGLGESAGTYRHSSEEPDAFGWSFTWGYARRNGWRFEVTGYEPIDDVPAFKEMTLDDARWMARLIGQLSEEQIIAGLIASGLESAEVRIYVEKLISRRDGLIRDTGLAEEMGLLKPNGVNRKFCYDPGCEGPVRMRSAGGLEIEARAGEKVLSEGKVKER